MKNKDCDIISTKVVKEKRFEIIDGYLIKYYATNKTVWSEGKMIEDQSHSYWQ